MVFPWLDYDYVETEEALGGEVEVHTFQVHLYELGKSYLRVEEYFEWGAPEPDEADTSSVDGEPADNEEDEAEWIKGVIERDKG